MIMNTRAPRGNGTITKNGYRRIRVDGIQRYEHHYVWEQYNGPVPKGKHIIHKNDDRLDNCIENLELQNNLPGYGYLDGSGYRDIWVDGKQKKEHRHVWESHNGPIPEGKEIHHKNEDKLDNRIENLELIDRLSHKRLHSGCIIKDGVELKPCRKCEKYKPIDQYYQRKDGISPWCKSCQKCNSTRNYHLRTTQQRG